MRMFRCISAIVLALAVTLGGSGYAPMPSDAEAMAGGKMAAMAPDQPMPDCPMCAPDEAVGPMCAPGCPTAAAILPLSIVVAVRSVASRQVRSPASHPADAHVGPEPPPPKPTILS
jgi:hypothetical protein